MSDFYRPTYYHDPDGTTKVPFEFYEAPVDIQLSCPGLTLYKAAQNGADFAVWLRGGVVDNTYTLTVRALFADEEQTDLSVNIDVIQT